MRGRNPKGVSLTSEQEAEFERYESMMARARIYEMGVAAVLNGYSRGEFITGLETAEAVKVLSESVELRLEAQAGRKAVQDAAAGIPPPDFRQLPRTRSRVRVKKRA